MYDTRYDPRTDREYVVDNTEPSIPAPAYNRNAPEAERREVLRARLEQVKRGEQEDSAAGSDTCVTVELIDGEAGRCIGINDYRICGPKPIHGVVVSSWKTTKNDILRAFLTPDQKHDWLAKDLTVTPVENEPPAPAAQEAGEEWQLSVGGLTVFRAPTENAGYIPLMKSSYGDWQENDPAWPTKDEAQAIMRSVVDNHNTYRSLSAERERLIVAASRVIERLQDLPRFLEKNGTQTLADTTAECLADLAAAIPAPLTTERG